MRKLILISVILLMLPTASWSLGYFNISSSSLQQLDLDSYRLRVNVDFGDISWQNPETYITNFHTFSLSLLGSSQYNTTFNGGLENIIGIPGYWSAGDFGFSPGSFSSFEFGYDFDLTAPLTEPLTMTYDAHFMSNAISVYDPVTKDFLGYDFETTNFTGSFTVGEINPSAVPEPASMLLFGLGLVGAGIIRRKKKIAIKL